MKRDKLNKEYMQNRIERAYIKATLEKYHYY